MAATALACACYYSDGMAWRCAHQHWGAPLCLTVRLDTSDLLQSTELSQQMKTRLGDGMRGRAT